MNGSGLQSWILTMILIQLVVVIALLSTVDTHIQARIPVVAK